MATTKVKGTNAKIKELKGIKPEKITDKQLKKVQDTVNNLNRSQLEIGSMEVKKHEMMHQIAGLRDALTVLQSEFEKDYKNDAMHYAVGQEVYGGHTICDIIEEKDKFSVYIKKKNDVLPWKDFNKNMAVSVEYNLEY